MRKLQTNLLLAAIISLVCSVEICSVWADRVQQADALSALWSFYKFNYIENGRVISHDEKGVTTSEGQSYAMLRSVWVNDRATFDTVWNWTKKNLRVREDNLFAWKYNNNRVLDRNAATDADVDIALSLILASRKFNEQRYAQDAKKLMVDIWEKEVVEVNGKFYLTGGNWAKNERYPTIHVAYLAPYAYETFAGFDKEHQWMSLVNSSYEILNWIYFEQELKLPPEIIYIDKKSGNLLLSRPHSKDKGQFSYDAFPVFWRVAVDFNWYGRKEEKLRQAMLAFFEDEWNDQKKFYDTYSFDGDSKSEFEALPLYATVHALALVEGSKLANDLKNKKLNGLWKKAIAGSETPYYFHNWLWFDRAVELKAVRNYTEALDFLAPIEFGKISDRFPWILFIAAIILFLIQRFENFKFRKFAKVSFLFLGIILCARYFVWRILATLNFLEPVGPLISITLLIAEMYCFSTVIFLLIQVGLDPKHKRKPAESTGYMPTVDIFIPIYSESAEILEKTVIAALDMEYPHKRVHVCDDSHRDEIVKLARALNVNYIRGPKKHAKAGNLNNAFTKTDGELLVIFDTDHIPVCTFLRETVPYFCDPKVGMLQTPHHFSNADIFQRAFGKEHSVPDESAMFNHGVQGARDNWGGAFFVGSGAVFRRSAIEQIGGFQLLSITEDIHTSQHLHSRGWESVFVNKDLLSGLTAENLSSFIVQRRRWMLGCLQIFLKDNPLFMKGLSFRHRWGYFASLYYFFYPIPKVLFWMTPLLFLLFHLHPIFSDVTVLLAYLIPYMVILPMINSALLPGWPRMLWGEAYENLISFQMFRSIFDLFLPKSLGFKVTPKGITSNKRSFDFRSSKATIVAAGISVIAITKGIFEWSFFGIERDAYFFNMGWAIYNLMLLASALLVAWERPQRRSEDRVTKPFRCRIIGEDGAVDTRTIDMGLDGMAVRVPQNQKLPAFAIIELDGTFRIGARMVYCEKIYRNANRCGYKFEGYDHEMRKKMFLRIFGSPETWCDAHDNRPKSEFVMFYHYLSGMIKSFFPQRISRRFYHRELVISPLVLMSDDKPLTALLFDRSENGIGVIILSQNETVANAWAVPEGAQHKPLKHVYTKKILPHIWKTGFEFIKEIEIPAEEESLEATMLIGR